MNFDFEVGVLVGITFSMVYWLLTYALNMSYPENVIVLSFVGYLLWIYLEMTKK